VKRRVELPDHNYPLCMNCIRVADAMNPVEWVGEERCVICGGPGEKPGSNKNVARAFEVYFERLEMAFSRASHGARA
jgi:hypothetical protein